MDIKEYISTGILELYAAGALNKGESKEVEESIKNHPNIKDEYEKIQKTIFLSASLNLKEPTEKVKKSLLNKIKMQGSSSTNINLVQDISYNKQSNTYRYLMAASIVFLLLSLLANFFLWTQLKDAKNEIAVLLDQRKVMVQQYEAVNQKLDKASKDMEIMKDRSYKMVDLKGLENSPGSNVLAFWNPETKKVFVEVRSLPVPPPDKQYQLWAISNGKPVDAGVMDLDPAGKSLHEMKSIEDAQAFAVTLEPKGGSVNPSMDQMYVMGKL